MTLVQNLKEYISAAFPGIWVKSFEHDEAIKDISDLCKERKWYFAVWDASKGVQTKNQHEKTPSDASSAIQKIAALANDIRLSEKADNDSPVLFIMLNLHRFLGNAMLVQHVYHQLLAGKRDRTFLLVLSPVIQIPIEIEKQFIVVDHELPSTAQLDRVIKLTADQTELPQDKNEYASLLNSAKGLTRYEAEGATSLSIIRHKKVTPAVMWEMKSQMLKKSGLLTIHEGKENFADIGGLDHVKDFCLKVLKQSTNRHPLAIPRGILCLGVAGCLSGDTKINYRRGRRSSNRHITIKELYDKFNKTGICHSGLKWRDGLNTYAQAWNPETGNVVFNRIRAVTLSGIKHCIKLTTDCAGVVTLTPDHPVLTEHGRFIPAEDLCTGDKILVRGDMLARPSDLRKIKIPRFREESLKYHPTCPSHSVKDSTTGKVYTYGREYRARLVVEAHMNGLSYASLVCILKNDPVRASSLIYLPKGVDVHHLDDNPQNDTIDNLVVVDHAEHALIHADAARLHVQHTQLATIVSVENVGELETYDISMELPYTNFVVNDGIIVHNSGKSALCKALGNETGRPVLQVDMSKIMGHLYGQTEGNMSHMLALADAMAPCVLLLDEIDKALSGTQSSGELDSGVTNRWFGQFLTWLSDHTSDVYVVGSCNRIDHLPAAFSRSERFDAIFFFDLPTREEKDKIWEIYTNKFGLQQNHILVKDVNWTGAEIRSCCRLSSLLQIPLVKASELVVPVADTSEEDVLSLRKWANNRCLSATKFGRYTSTESTFSTVEEHGLTKPSRKLQRSN